MEAIDVHFPIVPPRLVDLVRGQALWESVEVERAADVDRLTLRPVLATAARLGAPLFLHPDSRRAGAARRWCMV